MPNEDLRATDCIMRALNELYPAGLPIVDISVALVDILAGCAAQLPPGGQPGPEMLAKNLATRVDFLRRNPARNPLLAKHTP